MIKAINLVLPHVQLASSVLQNDTPVPLGLSFELRPGDRVALTGPSGSGKSILLRTLGLLEQMKRGELLYQNKPIPANEVRAYRRAVAYVAQRPWLYGDSVREAFRQPFSLGIRKDQRYDEEEAVRWLSKAGKNADFLEKSIATLSGGEAQVASLVRSIMLEPEVLLLDEPTAALDRDSARAIETLVSQWFAAAGSSNEKQSSRAYVWISHDPEQADRIGALRWHIANGVMTPLSVDSANPEQADAVPPQALAQVLTQG